MVYLASVSFCWTKLSMRRDVPLEDGETEDRGGEATKVKGCWVIYRQCISPEVD